jgi:ADP-ribosylglycohydrolase
VSERGPARLDRFIGCIVGLAVGDALGFPAEFRRRAQILAAFPPDGLRDFVSVHDPRWPERPFIAGKRHPPGTYSDDTQMTIALAEGLLDVAADASLDEAMRAVATRFVAWAGADDNDRAPGNSCLTGCRSLARGVEWASAGVADSKGCGSVMRVAPVGLLFADDPARLLETARAQSLLTHRHPAAIEGAAAMALLVALALHGLDPTRMLAAVQSKVAGVAPDLDACLAKVPELIAAPPELALSREGFGEAWTAEDAVASALYCFLRSPDDFETVVRTAANTDGDSDSIACMAGAIAGAYVGASGIPERFRSSVENSAALHDLGRRLFERARSEE